MASGRCVARTVTLRMGTLYVFKEVRELAGLVPRVCPLIVRDAEYLSSVEKLLEFLLSIFHLGISAGMEVA